MPKNGRSAVTAVLFAWLMFASFAEAGETPDAIGFNRDIRPILAKHCFACHGMDEASRSADLRLDRRADAIESGAIASGRPDASELIVRIESSDPETVMPPPDSGHALSVEEIKTLRRWVEQGAEYEKHWSFSTPVKPQLPAARTGQSIHPIDRFVQQKLDGLGLRPSPEAGRLELIRRLSLDLTGLPPSVEEADEFLSDPSPKAYEVVVDRLLHSEAYGEHWARMWLDLARYADTKGYEKDRPRSIWRYRDWVIDALNRDLPFDQFSIEQLAGDLLPEPTEEQILATAFHRNTMENEEGGTDDEEFRVAAVKDRVDTTMQVWMGLTMGCAKCHSHKYDPISQRDYYMLYAFFNQTEDADREQPKVATPTREQRQRIARLEDELATLRERTKTVPEGYDRQWQQWKHQFDDRPLWEPLQLVAFQSRHEAQLIQDQSGTFQVPQELPEKDTWVLEVAVSGQHPVTAIRLETTPKPKGGKWADKNVALRELTLEWMVPGKEPVKLKLVRPRADFSQNGWEVARAIDGKPDAGWAFSPQASQPHCAVFDLETPVQPVEGSRFRLTLEQEYGQGLTLKTFRLEASSHPVGWLTAELNPGKGLEDVFRRNVCAETKQRYEDLDAKRSELQAFRRGIPTTPIMRELPVGKTRETRVHTRGNFLDQGDLVEGQVPSAFGKLSKDAPRNRLGVAQWLMDPGNPLTARVAVNRVWAQLFGIGLVETEEDFGTQGTLPSHPELLDWMAVDFRENGWSFRKLLKTIVLSETYRQSSQVTTDRLESDPRNRWLSRGPRFRLSAETVRDQALAASGLLSRQVGGPSVMPPQPTGIWKTTYSGEKWKDAVGSDRYRRAVYTYKKRTSPYPAMITFDSGSGEVCQIRRVRTNTPLQALVTLNDTAYVEAAGALANVMKQAGGSKREQIAHGFRRVLIRHAESNELDRLVALYESLSEDLSDGGALLKSAGLSEGDPRLVAVANVLLNLDEALMKP